MIRLKIITHISKARPSYCARGSSEPRWPFNWQGSAATTSDSHEVLYTLLSQLPGQAFGKGSQGRALVSQMAI